MLLLLLGGVGIFGSTRGGGTNIYLIFIGDVVQRLVCYACIVAIRVRVPVSPYTPPPEGGYL